MGNILYYFIAILILAILIVVHEFGHYIVGRVLGFKVLEFAVGFGPKLIKWERKGIKYSIRAIPLGGFCSFAGEDEDNHDDPRAMNNMPWYKRLAVLFSGVGFNIIFAIIIGFVLFCTSGYSIAVIKSVEVGTPLAATQAAAGDMIVAVNGQQVTTSKQLSNMLDEASINDQVTLTIQRDDKQFDVTTAFYVDYKYDSKIEYEILTDGTVKIYSIGEGSYFAGKDIAKGDVVIAANGEKIDNQKELSNIISQTRDEELTLTLSRNGKEFYVSGKLNKEPYKRVGVTLMYQPAAMPIGEAFVTSINAGIELSGDILEFMGKLVTGQADISMVTGPVTTIGTMGNIVSQSAAGGIGSLITMVLNLMWAISLNLAIFNLLPIPALDGARMVFVIIEAIRRKPINRELEAKIHGMGFLVLISLVVVLEVSKIFTGMGGTPVWM